jgi:hypothetical protein
MADFTREYTSKNGTIKMTIAAASTERMARVIRELNAATKSRVSSLDADLERNIEFKIALAASYLTGLELDGVAKDAQGRREWVRTYPGASDTVIDKAKNLETEFKAELEADEKN